VDPLTAEESSHALSSGRSASARLVAALSYRYPVVAVRPTAEDPTLRETKTAAVSGTGDLPHIGPNGAEHAYLDMALLTRH
jgi:hypothetical protein